jgi:hypothetical protein
MEYIPQIMILLCGCSAVWIVGRKEKWRRWGYILGLIGQPFWFIETLRNEQYGIFLMCLWYTYAWGQGVYNYWIKK